MAEVEYGGVKLTGSKLFMIIPLVSMLGGGLGLVEFYKDYMDTKEQQRIRCSDLSEFDKKLDDDYEEMKVTKETVTVFQR